MSIVILTLHEDMKADWAANDPYYDASAALTTEIELTRDITILRLFNDGAAAEVLFDNNLPLSMMQTRYSGVFELCAKDDYNGAQAPASGEKAAAPQGIMRPYHTQSPNL